MTEVTEAARERCAKLANAVLGDTPTPFKPEHFGLNGFVDRQAFVLQIQRISDVVRPIMKALQNSPDDNVNHLAAQLAEFVLEEPVDPLLIEAREQVAKSAEGKPWATNWKDRVLAGEFDHEDRVQIALASLQRGLVLARKGDAA